jgi:hypothetical protein
MIGKRFIDGDTLLGKIHFGEDSALAKWLKRQPKAPKLIGRQRAAEIIGVGSPYITVLVEKGDLTPVPVAGGPDVYDEAEVKALAKVYKKRQRKRNGGS